MVRPKIILACKGGVNDAPCFMWGTEQKGSGQSEGKRPNGVGAEPRTEPVYMSSYPHCTDTVH